MALAWLVAFLVLWPWAMYESLRFNMCVDECYARFERNRELLRQPLCSDPSARLRHQDKVSCGAAESENMQSPTECAIRAWWTEFHPWLVASALAQTWYFYAILVFVAYTLITSWFTYHRDVQWVNQIKRLH